MLRSGMVEDLLQVLSKLVERESNLNRSCPLLMLFCYCSQKAALQAEGVDPDSLARSSTVMMS